MIGKWHGLVQAKNDQTAGSGKLERETPLITVYRMNELGIRFKIREASQRESLLRHAQHHHATLRRCNRIRVLQKSEILMIPEIADVDGTREPNILEP